MKKTLLFLLTAITMFFFPKVNFGQAPALGSTSSYAVFTANGAFNNLGATQITGDIGTNVGAFSGFPPGVVIGQTHIADASSAQAATDVDIAYSSFGVACSVIGTTLGNNQLLMPNTYCTGAASTLNGNLILDAQGNPNALFIIKIGGALSTTTSSSVTLVNSASACNVYWQVNGAVSLGINSNFVGTILANGAISLAQGASLSGRALSRSGAVSLNNNRISRPAPPVAAIIVASGATTFCAGGSVTLSGNVSGVFSTGATTPSITVTTSGDYFVTNTNGCGSSVSNHIIVTVNPLPMPTITASGPISFCQGGSVVLTSSPASSYLWTTGATTRSITVTTSGIFRVVVTDANGCMGTSAPTIVMVTPTAIPTITANGPTTFCQGGSVILTSSPASSYMWSTGATTQSITVTASGSYTVTTPGPCGGTSAPVVVTVTPAGVPTISASGPTTFCQGGSVVLTSSPASSYMWSTGATTQSITVTTSGSFTVTTSGVCAGTSAAIVVTVIPLPNCTISGNGSICNGQSTQLCAPSGFKSYLWNTGATTNCITVTTAGTYSVTVTNVNGCSSVCSKNVSGNGGINCTITGCDNSICEGESVILCASSTAGCNYYWNTGSTSRCITVSRAGTYSVTVTNSSGCSSVCSKTITVDKAPLCYISGCDNSICDGQWATLCANSASGCTYRWNTGSTYRCININGAGTYTVTVTNANGCRSICSKKVTATPSVKCLISGNLSICQYQSTKLCAPYGCAAYKWNTGSTASCIIVTCPGTYSVTITNANGCISTCSVCVTSSNGYGDLVSTQTPEAYLPESFRKFETEKSVNSLDNAVSNDLSMPQIASNPLLLSVGKLEAQAYPNPFVNTATIEFRSPKGSARAKVEVFNVNGEKVALLFDGALAAGELKQVKFDAINLSSGVYYYRITDGEAILNRRIIIARN